MKKILLLFVSLFIVFFTFAQDVIVTKEGKKINAKVTEVNENDIKYKIFENLDGPVYTMKKSEIATVMYENGHVEVYNINVTAPPPPAVQQPSYYAPRQYTMKAAKDLRDAGIGLFATGMAFTFPIGLSLVYTNYVYRIGNYYYYNYSHNAAALSFIIMGPPIAASGIVMWIVGQTRMNRIRMNPQGISLFENEKVQFNLALGGNTMGLKLNF